MYRPLDHGFRDFKFWVRVAALGLLVAIATLSLAPHGADARAPAFGTGAHLLAYAGASLLLAVGAGRRQAWVNVSYLSAAAAVFELAQGLVPGRLPGLDNWVSSSSGAMLGAMAVTGASWLWAHHKLA